MKLEEKLDHLPQQSGVYLMKDRLQEIIYVGKARNLRNRVRQYFTAAGQSTPKVKAMMQHVVDFETMITDTEVEALILECNLIKENRPKYNVLLRDDKSYPYIKITWQEEYPRVFKTRKIIRDGSQYFGPYTDVGALNETLELIRQLFPVKTCNKKVNSKTGKIERPCLNYHLRQCLGPCQGNVYKDEYNEMIQEVVLLLDGKENRLINQLEEKMKVAAEEMNFEKAALYRDQWDALKKVTEKQKMDSGKTLDQDVIALESGRTESCVQVFSVRDGKIVKQHHHFLKGEEEENIPTIIASFIKLYYDNAPFIPGELLMAHAPEDEKLIEKWLTEKRGRKVSIKMPQRGDKRKLVELVQKNARLLIDQREKARLKKESDRLKTLTELGELTGLIQPPGRIEAVDISQTAGTEPVGVLIVYEDGVPHKRSYRRFKINTITGPDDTGSIREVMRRRFKRGLKEAEEIRDGSKEPETAGFALLPDLILVDGGVGQVSATLQVLEELNLQIPVAGMVKDDRHRTRSLYFDGENFDLKEKKNLWRFITTIQDEVHRFAIDFHRQRRSKALTGSELENIPGIGEKSRHRLLDYFKGIQNIKEATIQEIKEVEGIGQKQAEAVHSYFNTRQKEEG
ncbi:MAG: excinuclease ABC subunit UvrC [Tindallia sp. MSAO_Bac2]|nr:MAG: excinuclease ABC subunit UvrC [Tindallia sp. MSAO_Bac2]